MNIASLSRIPCETLMVDIFDYEAPYGIFGNLCDRLFLKDYMLRLLEKRNTVIKEVAETTKWKEILHVQKTIE